jgi:hypothetical protein
MSGGSKNGWSRRTGRYPFAIPRFSQTIMIQEESHANQSCDSATARFAGGQRHYYTNGTTTADAPSCGKAGTIAAGPLNYAGINPKITCAAFQGPASNEAAGCPGMS